MKDHEMNSFPDDEADLNLFALRKPVTQSAGIKREDRIFESNLYHSQGKPFEFLLEDSEQLSRGIRYVPLYNSIWSRYKSGIFKLFRDQHLGRTEQDIERGLFDADWGHKAFCAFDDLWNHAYFQGRPVASIPNNYSAIRSALTDQSISNACLKIMLGLTGWVLCQNTRGEQRLFHPLLVRLAINASYLTEYSDRAIEQKRASLKASKKDLFAMNVPVPVKAYDHGHFVQKTGYGLLNDPVFIYRKRAVVVVGNDFVPQRKESPIFKDIIDNPTAAYEFVRSGVDVNVSVALICAEAVGEKNPNTKVGVKYDRSQAHEYALQQLRETQPFKIYSVVDPDTLADHHNQDLKHINSVEHFTGKINLPTRLFTGKPNTAGESFTGKTDQERAGFTGLNKSEVNTSEVELEFRSEEKNKRNINFSEFQITTMGNNTAMAPASDIEDQNTSQKGLGVGLENQNEVRDMREIHPLAVGASAYEFRAGRDAESVEFNQRVYYPACVRDQAKPWLNVSQFVSTVVYNGFAANGGASLLNLRKQWDKLDLCSTGGVHMLALKRGLSAARKKREESIRIGDPSGMGCLCSYIVSVCATQSAFIKSVEQTFAGLSSFSLNKLLYASSAGISHARDVLEFSSVSELEKVLADCQEPAKLGLVLKKESERLKALFGSDQHDESHGEFSVGSVFHDDYIRN